MEIRRTEQAVYDLKYHLIWIPEYGKQTSGEVSRYLKEMSRQIAEESGFRIDLMAVGKDRIYTFIEVARREFHPITDVRKALRSPSLLRGNSPRKTNRVDSLALLRRIE